ncbi:MAG: rod shape-determining protein MreD [Nibricoccus sp.]
MTRTTFVLLGCCVIFWTLACQINHYLSPLHISVFTGGLLVSFSALRVGFREGWWCSILIGLLIDSSSLVYFGFHALIFAIVHLLIYLFRSRFPREETAVGVAVAIAANSVLFLLVTAGLAHRTPEPLSMLMRYFVDLTASAILIAVAGPWFFALQERALDLCGVSLRREQRGLL